MCCVMCVCLSVCVNGVTLFSVYISPDNDILNYVKKVSARHRVFRSEVSSSTEQAQCLCHHLVLLDPKMALQFKIRLICLLHNNLK